MGLGSMLKGAAKGAIGAMTGGGGGGILGGALKGAVGGGGNTTTSPSATGGHLGTRAGLPEGVMNASPSTDMGGMAKNAGSFANKFASGKKTTAARKFSSRR